MPNIKIGCDPEIFLRNRFTGEFVSAHGKFPGTKADPYPLDRGAVQVDGLALEFNILPASTLKEFMTNIQVVLKQVQDMVRKESQALELVFEPWADFEPTYFASLPMEPKVLGCDPDYDCDSGEKKVPRADLMDTPSRTAAGHMHVGWGEGFLKEDKEHFERCRKVALAFKNEKEFLPVTTLERKRIEFYGTPGSFRPKGYGVELRSSSNLWVKTPATRARMYNKVHAKMVSIYSETMK